MNGRKCRHPNPETAKFCDECGVGLTSRGEPPQGRARRSSAARNEVATRLEAAGCWVDRSGQDRLVAGERDFEEALGI